MRIDNFGNLAGKPIDVCNRDALAELLAAGIQPYEGVPSSDRLGREVKTSLVGLLQFEDGQQLWLERNYYYWWLGYAADVTQEQALDIQERTGGDIYWAVTSFGMSRGAGLRTVSRFFQQFHGSRVRVDTQRAEERFRAEGLSGLRKMAPAAGCISERSIGEWLVELTDLYLEPPADCRPEKVGEFKACVQRAMEAAERALDDSLTFEQVALTSVNRACALEQIMSYMASARRCLTG